MTSRMRFVLGMLAVVGVCVVVGAASVAQADIIAQWQFEPGAFLADSSGHGHDLTQVGTVASNTTDLPTGGGAGCAQFSAAGYFKTSASLDLTGYSDIRVSWSMKVGTSSWGQVVDDGFYSTVGGWSADVNDLDVGHGFAALKSLSDSNISDNLLNTYGATAPWEDWTVEFNRLAASNSDVILVYKNGILQTSDRELQDTRPSSFLNALLYIGARAAGDGQFTGLIDNVRIESVPEPGTFVLLATGLIGLLAYAWRKRK